MKDEANTPTSPNAAHHIAAHYIKEKRQKKPSNVAKSITGFGENF